jgi:hypothetical protein
MATLVKKAVKKVEERKFEIGEVVEWVTGAYYDGRDWGSNSHSGEIIRINRTSVTVEDNFGNTWRVKYEEIID